MKVIDDFLPLYYFKQLQDFMIDSGSLPWYYNSSVVSFDGKIDDQFQFTHTFWDDRPPWNGTASTYYDNISFCLQKLGVNKLIRCKANLRSRTIFHRKAGYHTDFDDVTTAILYMNTNNGWTEFKKGGKVKSVENRIVIFDSNLMHQGTTCTDQKTRVVLNFNYV